MILEALTRLTATVRFAAVRFLSLNRLPLNASEVCSSLLRFDSLVMYISFAFL
jgi:hypothetical protein